jgi:hypothetical protein
LDVQGEDRPVVVSPPDADAFVAAIKSGIDFDIALPPGDAMLLKLVPGLASLFLFVTTTMVIGVLVYGPRRMRYVVEGDRLVIRTMFSRRDLALSEIRARAHVPKVTLRLFGTAFPGYYTGLYRADGANTRIAATDLKGGVLIEGPVRLYVSPEEPSAFLAALRAGGATA